MRLSFLDLVPLAEGDPISRSLANAAEIARHCEENGYDRYWIAEHHSTPFVGSAATSLVIGHVGAHTRTIRVGAGGIMLPNHPPLAIAEQFGTLDALYPGRIDLGLGRAPGSDAAVAAALRRSPHSDPGHFIQEILELQGYFAGEGRPGVRAIPGAGAALQTWVLGSSVSGAQVAAALGRPFAFASHFAPAQLHDALRLYRDRYQPSPEWPQPHVMVACNVYAADDRASAALLASSIQQAFVRLRSGRDPGQLPPPRNDYLASLSSGERAIIDSLFPVSAIGTKSDVTEFIGDLAAKTGADEIIISCQAYDHVARMASISIAAEAVAALP